MILFGKRIKRLRNFYHLTQTELGLKVGVTKSTIAAYENDTRMPSYDTLIRLARVFHVTTDTLLLGKSGKTINAEGLDDGQIALLETVAESFRMNNSHYISGTGGNLRAAVAEAGSSYDEGLPGIKIKKQQESTDDTSNISRKKDLKQG